MADRKVELAFGGEIFAGRGLQARLMSVSACFVDQKHRSRLAWRAPSDSLDGGISRTKLR